ncbi:A24 family peptidase [Natrialba asiatica]|uniref:Peptidase A24A prepilin type IV n=1 Tax=Natrialba asiatica (strain ATCC 700177 / DSM 12278 / JCM 9576 / FERM P-10747 / NBRC 102637 / 172P1) TaxID=29540 RepID=M0AHG3_NATA1|nr:A24 family peptidase [Natrialba asiatica]ELY98120.1 peptidase A24A prepilin type IV [Natrialba asiatica DSM 12278]
MSLAFVSATGPDLLRLLALPVFAWTAVRDIKTRRVSSHVWVPLSLLGAGTLLWEGVLAWRAGGTAWIHEFIVPATVSLGLVVPLAYLFWWAGGFGGADAKALLVLAVVFPTQPIYAIGSWTTPTVPTPIGTFSFTILTNAVLVALAIPILLAIRNAAAGRFTSVMALGWPVSWERLPEAHGQLLEGPAGRSTSGLDLDALRMYLRWRGLTLADIRESPDRYRDPATLPEEPNPPTDGAVAAAVRADGGAPTATAAAESRATGDKSPEKCGDTASTGQVGDHDDPWGADAFLDDIEGTAYGTAPEQLRAGLEAVTTAETVWISPGTPFLVPIFSGLVIALGYGDLLFGLLGSF